MILRGAQNLSNAELVAIMLRTGTKGKSVIQVALELIVKYDNVAQLALQSVESLSKNIGIGRDKAATLVAAFELSKRIDLQKKWFSNKKVTSPDDVAGIFIPLLRDEVKEKFIVVCLNSSNKIIKYEVVSIGTLNSSLIHAREVFKVAIENNSANIILIHNHPSGNPEPSREDIEITKKLVEAGNLLEIKVFDHIIIAQTEFVSMIDRKIV